MQKVSCIIPAYNEAPRIEAVLRVVVGHPLVHEIIVIDDGSTDGTGERVRAFSTVKLLVNDPNRGKSASVARGMNEAQHELILLLDADLVGMTVQHVTDLIEPVLRGEVDMTMSLRGNSLRTYRLLGIDFFSGERVFAKKHIADFLDHVALLPGYFLETYLNRIFVREALRIAVVDWPEVIQTRKANKIGLWRGVWKEARMAYTIARHESFWQNIIVQNYCLWKLVR